MPLFKVGSLKSISMNKKFPTLAIAVAAFCLASCHCDDYTPTTSKYTGWKVQTSAVVKHRQIINK